MKLRLPGMFLAALLLLPATAFAQELVTNGDFETGDMTGWTVVNAGSIATLIYEDGDVTSELNWPLPAPNGVYGVYTDMDSESYSFIYQDITLPPGTGAAFSARLYYANFASPPGDNGEQEGACSAEGPTSTPIWLDIDTLEANQGLEDGQQYRIDVMDPNAAPDDMGAGILQTLFATSDDSPSELGPETITADLGAFGGQTIRLRFLNYNTFCFLHSALDDISVLAAVPPPPPPAPAADSVPVPTDHPGFLALLVLALMGFGFAILRSRPA